MVLLLLLLLEFLLEFASTFFPGSSAFSSRNDACLRDAAATGVFGNIAISSRGECCGEV